MTPASLALIAVYLLVALVLVKPVGLYIANVVEGRPIWPLRVGAGLERFIYRLCGTDPQDAMDWKSYAIALVLFNALGALAVYALQRLQLWLPLNPQASMDWKQYAIALVLFNALGALAVYALQRLQLWLPLNPQGFANVSPDSSFNTAVSFITNTNWQGYSGESTMSYLTQMAGLAVQNFLSAATGIVVAVALIRGFVSAGAKAIGNFWVDMTRCTLYVLLPLSIIIALLLVSQGVVQNLSLIHI